MSSLPPGANLSSIPLAVNPDGDPPDFGGGPSLQPAVLGTGAAFVTVSFIAVLIRLYAVFKSTRKLYPEDYVCLLGELFAIAYWATDYTVHSRYDGFRHSWDIAVSSYPYMAEIDIVEQVLSGVAHTLVKCSITLFYIRFFSILDWVRIVCYMLLTFIPIFYTTYVALGLGYCIPGPGYDWITVAGKCTKIAAPATVAAGVFAVLIDIILFALPFFVISRLNLNKDKKRGLAILFLFGFLIVASSVVDLAYRVIIFLGLYDAIWNGTNVTITSYTEMFGTVIVSCAPGLYSFWRASVIQSSLYQSICSFFRNDSRNSLEILGHSVEKLHSCPPGEGCSICANARRGNGTLASSSSQELVNPSIPLEGITKHTVIKQRSDIEPDLEKSQNGRWEMENTAKNW
ncbi:hypothetical protein F5Y16DRAFT_395394 [Xylariaceae sp. FL0255]|nr:hypothetical protein F5Y16DRAFT_395394 [Xylariaceae sp. FL0255]